MVERSEKEKVLAGKLYRVASEELAADAARADRLLYALNATTADEWDGREELIRELLGAVG